MLDPSAAPTPSSPADGGRGGLLQAVGRHLRRARNLPAVLPRLAAVRECRRYAVNEFRLVPLAARYRLRRSGLTIYVRHHSADGDRLADVFIFGRYRPPAEAATRLAAIGPAPRVLDLAAGVGYFGIWLLGRHPEAQITAVEPDPLAAVVLRRTIRANSCASRWKVRDGLPAGADSLAGIDVLRLGPHADAARVIAEYTSCPHPRLLIVDSSETADLVAPHLDDHEWALAGRDPLWAWAG